MLAPLLLLALGQVPAVSIPDPRFLRDVAETKNFTRGRPLGVEVTPDGSAVLFLESGPRSSALSLFSYDVASGKTVELITPAQVLGGEAEVLSVAEKARRERLRETERGFTRFGLSRDGERVLLPLSGKLFVVDRRTRAVHVAYAGAEPAIDPQLSPAGDRVAYVRGADLYVTEVGTAKEHALTRGGTADVFHGLAEFVAQEELGRFTGHWWSPDGKQLAYTEVDQTGVEHFTISDPAHPERPSNVFAYPRPGKANARVRLGLIPVGGGDTTWVGWDAVKYPYLARVLWPEKQALPILVVLSRDQRDEALLQVLPGGKTEPVLTQHDDAWLDLHPGSPRALPGKGVVLLSQGREGIELVWQDIRGQRHLLLPASAGVRALQKVDETSAYVLASADPTQTQLWRVPLDGSAPVQLSTGVGEHGAVFAAHAEVYVEGFTDEVHLPRSTVHVGGKPVGELPSQAEEPSFVPNVAFTTVDVGGLTFQAAILRPRDFDPARRYPVIDSVYGGPTYNVVARSESALLLDQWYADHGFIVVRVDNRGTPRRGRGWERAIVGDLGTVPLEDQIAAVQALGARHPEMDLSRVGITGWSFGGYLSGLAILKRPDFFKCGVAGAPVVDWTDYDTTYTERYLQTPETNPAGYARSSLLTYAANLSRPLLVIHGTADDNVYFFHSLKLMDALFRAGKRADFEPLIDYTHVVADPAVRERLYGMVIDYFTRHLGTPTAPAR